MSDVRHGEGTPRDGRPLGGMADEARQDAGAIGQQARAAAGEIGSQARAATGRVREEASGVVEDLKQEGAEVAEAARERAMGLAEQGQRVGAEQAQGWARALHRAADSLDEGGSGQVAQAIHQAAESVEGLARELADTSPAQLVGRVQDLARRQPVAFFGAAVLAGFALARFAKSSAEPATPSRGMHAGGHAPHGMGHGIGRPDDLPGGGLHATGGGTAMPRSAAMGAPGWVPTGEDAPGLGQARPATMAAASLGGAAARPAGTGATTPLPMPGPGGATSGTTSGTG